MAMQFPDAATKQWLTNVLNVSGIHLRLFSNNVTIGDTTVIGSLNEVSGGGYAAIALSAVNWAFVAASPSTAGYSDFLTFIFSGAPSPNTVYGYYITDPSGNLLAAENFTLVNPVAGTQIPIQLRVTAVMA